MQTYLAGINFVTMYCSECGIPYAITNDYKDRRACDHKSFYCPAGHKQHFPERDLEKEFEQATKISEKDMMSESQRKRKEQRAVKKSMADGSCPCCTGNRAYIRLSGHIRRQHPTVNSGQRCRLVRKVNGLEQKHLAEIIGIDRSEISKYERGSGASANSCKAIEAWLKTK